MKRKLFIYQLGLLLLTLYLAAACTPTGSEAPTDAAVEPSAGEVTASNSEEATTISFACHEYQLSTYESLAEQFQEENPDIKVQVLLIEDLLDLGEDRRWPDDGWQQLVRNADTLCGSLDPEAIKQGLFQDLTPFVETELNFQVEDFYPNTLESLQEGGQLWGLTGSMNFTFIYYDKAAFDEAGVAYPQPGWTWDDFLEKALALTKREGGETTQWGFVEQWRNSFIHGRIGSPFDLSTPLFDTPETIAAVRWYTDLHLEHEVMPFFPSPEADKADATSRYGGYLLVDEGKAAMWTESDGGLEWRRNQGDQADIAMVPFPIEHEGDLSTPMSARGSYMMSAGTAYPDASWRWLSFLSHNPLETRNTRLPARRSVAEAIQFWEELDENLTPVYRFAIEHALPQPPQSVEHTAYFYDAIETILAGEQALEPALTEAQRQAEQVLVEAAAEPLDTETKPLVVATPPVLEGTAITFATFGQTDPFRDLAKLFNETQPDITVKVHSPEFVSGFGLEEMVAEADCFVWFGNNSEDQQHLLNLDPFLETTSDFPMDDLYPQMLDVFHHRNSIWGIPQKMQIYILYYNRDLFDAAGVAYPQAGWTLDDFLTTAQTLTQGEGDDKQYGYLSLHGLTSDLAIFLSLMDATWLNTEADPTYFQFDDPALAEAMQWHLDLIQTHQVTSIFEEEDPTDPSSLAWQKRQDLMKQGQIAMWISPYSNMTDDLNKGLVPLPLSKKTETGTVGFVQGYFIAKDSPYPKACWSWITYLTEHNTATVTDGLPARRSVVESAEFRADVGEELIEAYLFSLEHSKVKHAWFETWILPGNQWLMQSYGQALEGIAVDTALTQAQEKAEAYTACLDERDGFEDEEIHEECRQQVDPDIE